MKTNTDTFNFAMKLIAALYEQGIINDATYVGILKKYETPAA